MNDTNIIHMADKAHDCLVKGRLEEARSLYSRLSHLDGGNEEVWLNLAVINGETGLLEEALQCAERALELDPEYVEACLVRAHLLQRLGRPEAALESALQAVAVDDEYLEAWQFLTALAAQLRRFADLESWARKAAELAPDNAEVLANLGHASYELGKPAEAEARYRRVLELTPDHLQAQIGLAKAIAAQQRFQEALETLTPVLKKVPEQSDVLDCLASCYANLGRVSDALAVLAQIIETDPGYIHAYLQLAELYQQQGDYLGALEYLRKARDIAADPLEVLGSMSKLYNDFGMQYQAIEACNEALMLDPGNVTARFYRALALGDTARYEEALAELESLEHETPADQKILGAKAALLEKLGDNEQAYAIVQRFFGADQIPGGIVNVFARLCHRFNVCDKAIEIIEQILETPGLASDYRRSLLFSLGKIHDRMGHYDAAFECVHKANELKHFHYDHRSYTDYIDRLLDPSVTRLIDGSRAGPGRKSSIRPVFIVGMPRSGTSLVEQIIAAHPAVHGGGERHEISSMAQRLPAMLATGAEYPECLASLDAERIGEFLRAYDTYTGQLPPGTEVLTDKMPNNYHHLVLIKMLFPEARIIHCVRDPLDTCLSIYFQQFTGYHDYAYDLANLGKHYLEYQRLMRNYRDVASIPMLEVVYEDLVHDTESISRKMIEYCGLAWDERCLRYYESDRVVRTASYEQARQPVYTSSIGRWKPYEKHLGVLIDALGAG